MDPIDIHDKVQVLAQKLLAEANGDRIRALGLLVMVIEGSDLDDPTHYIQLISEVRNLLMPPTDADPKPRPIQHLAGPLSWEGIQHCVRCGKVLARSKDRQHGGFPSGFVFQVGSRMCEGDYYDFDPCR